MRPAQRCSVRPAILGVLSVVLSVVASVAGPVLAAAGASPVPAAQTPALRGQRGADVSATATLDRTSVPATGRQQALLTVPRFGRYSVTVSSDQGVALQLVDHMAGPGEVVGEAGRTDGRLDVFLDQGTYRILTFAHEKGSGKAKLEVHAFQSTAAGEAPQLLEARLVQESLEDFQQRSWWLRIDEAREVALEAAGRNLADLRLWRDGNWLVDAAPDRQVLEPRSGQPLLACRLATRLEPGLYLLTAYGGPSQPWAQASAEHPLVVRYGIPVLSAADRRRYTLSPFGLDRFRVPGSVSYLRLELPRAAPATLEAGRYTSDRPFDGGSSRAALDKNSALPVAELNLSASEEEEQLVTISGAAGQPYVLEHFAAGGPTFSLPENGTYWVSTLHAGAIGDAVDATALIVRRPREGGAAEVVASDVVTLGAQGWSRRCNLLAPLTLFVKVEQAGPYKVVADGVKARVRLEPFLTSRPRNYKSPAFQGSGSSWDLEAGYQVLTVEPDEKGIVSLSLRPGGLFNSVKELAGFVTEAQQRPVTASIHVPFFVAENGYLYTLYLNRQPGVKVGLIARPLPVDATTGLSLTQRPDEMLAVPFRVTEAGTLRAEAEDGSRLPISLDGTDFSRERKVDPGSYTVRVRVEGAQTVRYQFRLEPTRLQQPLPPLPDGLRDAQPRFPLLTASSPLYFDLDREGSATFGVRADVPALYRLTSTGLLATAGNLRTRTVTSFSSAEQNGVGRNFLIQQYLRQGDYQLTVTARGQSRGHLGVRLEQARPLDGGQLVAGIPARITLPAGEAAIYQFKIDAPGDYRLRSIGRGRVLRCRLEDADGWPIAAPDLEADVTRTFEPGTYRLVLLPEPTETRRLTVLEPLPQPLAFEGHGPHPLPLATDLEHVWQEPAGRAARRPDVWRFSLPAPIEATLVLTDEMQADLVRIDGPTPEKVAYIPPQRGWKGRLEAGQYRLEATCVRYNNRVTYHLALWPGQLVDGLDRRVRLPASLPLSMGRDGLLELSSFGTIDVRARLFDADGRPVATGDDRPDDWNFLILRRVPAGFYRLQVASVSGESGVVKVSMRTPAEVERAPLTLPVSTKIGLESVVQLFPLALPPKADLLLVGARSTEHVGMSLEASTGGDWRTVSTGMGYDVHLETPVAPPGQAPATRYRLRLWSADLRNNPVQLNAVAVAASSAGEAKLEGGARLEAVAGTSPAVAAVAVDLAGPGLFHIAGDPGSVRWCASPEGGCQEATAASIPATGRRLWLVAALPAGQKRVTVRAARVTVAQGGGDRVQVDLPATAPVWCDLAVPARGPVVVVASSSVGLPGVGVWDAKDASLDAGSPGGVPAGSGSLSGAPAGAAPMGVGSSSTVAVSLQPPRAPVAGLWRAIDPGERMDARLYQVGFAAPSVETVATGVTDGVLEGTAARAFALPGGAKQVRIAVGEDTVAVLSDGAVVRSVHWNDGKPFEDTVDTTAAWLTLMHLRPGSARFSVEVLETGEAARPPLTFAAPLELRDPVAGRLRVPVAPMAGEPGRPGLLHVRGDVTDTVLVGAAGRVARGVDLPVPEAGGTLQLAHGPGVVLAWIDRPGEEAAGLWGTDVGSAVSPVDLPAVVSLSGNQRRLGLQPTRPILLHLRTASALVARVERSGAPPEVRVSADGGTLDVYLPGGSAQLSLRGVAGAGLWGRLEIVAAPVTPIGEGLGPPVLLPPGATRIFSFSVSRDGPVGIGVRADSDIVACALMDANGQKLGEGVVQMPTLRAGTYLLALHVPEGQGPVTARPALAGITPPDTGPPAEVVRQYLSMAADAPVSLLNGASAAAVDTTSWNADEPEVASPEEEIDEAPVEAYDEGGEGGGE